ncbi:VOC family protein [Paenibacillus sp. EKM208P]|nr:VOC family protein [Paenibacillus sp. EKM208P]
MNESQELLQFHHIGIACGDLQREIESHNKLGYMIEGEMFSDPIQHVKGQFMTLGKFRVEILEAISSPSPIDNYLKSNCKMYHQAYECDQLSAAMSWMRKLGAKLIAGPNRAVAFQGREIAFFLLRNSIIIELIQKRI